MEKINKTISRLLLDHPWLSALVLRLETVPDDNIHTFATDGKHLIWNPKFLEKISYDEAVGCVAHEAMHCALLHHLRRNEREENRWNIACDFAINPLLWECGLILPFGSLLGKKYEKMSAEEIYDKLPEQKASMHCLLDGEETEEASDWGQAFVDAITAAKHRGIESAALNRLFDALAKPSINWREILHRTIRQGRGSDDYSWQRISRRGLALSQALPGMVKLKAGNIIIIIDTSGSMSKEELSAAIAEIRSAAEYCEKIVIIEADSKILRETELHEQEIFNPNLVGGGGTDFGPALRRATDLSPETIVYITDLECDFPKPNGIAQKTIWLTKSQKTAPWGLTIKMEEN